MEAFVTEAFVNIIIHAMRVSNEEGGSSSTSVVQCSSRHLCKSTAAAQLFRFDFNIDIY
jgi:hypothetical protein